MTLISEVNQTQPQFLTERPAIIWQTLSCFTLWANCFSIIHSFAAPWSFYIEVSGHGMFLQCFKFMCDWWTQHWERAGFLNWGGGELAARNLYCWVDQNLRARIKMITQFYLNCYHLNKILKRRCICFSGWYSAGFVDNVWETQTQHLNIIRFRKRKRKKKP